MYSRDVDSNVSQDDVKCDALDYVKYEASPNAQPNRSMSVAELSQMRCANKMSSANISSEQAKNISFTACLKNPGWKPKIHFEVQTTSRGKFSLTQAKGGPPSEENLAKTFNKQKAASEEVRKKEHNHIHTSNNTHNFRGANNMSTPTKRKDFGGGGGAVQSLLCIFEDTIITKPTRGDYQESPAKRRKCGRQGSN